MKKILFTIGVIVVIGLGLYVVFNIAPKIKTDSQKITVVTTLFPLYDFAKNIGQDKVEVSLLLPPGVEAHTFEPKPSDISKINNANIFVYTGKFMEPWAHDIIQSVLNNKLLVVDSSKGITLIPGVFHDEDEPVGSMDPHIWLDFSNAKIMAQNIESALQQADPKNAIYYQNNLKNYQSKLDDLDKAYKNTLYGCQTKTIVYGGHYAFGYLAKRYGLQYIAAQGVSPDAEPSAKDIIDLVNQIKKDNIKYVFYEELTSPKIAETLANETNAKLLLLNGAHNLAKEDYESGATFISLMESNLKNLSLGLNCQQ